MTRLDLFIARMVSQRACIDHSVALTRNMTGPVFELGLGNGRTFDHIRAHVQDRDIFVFERAVASNPASTPDPDQLVLGDVFDTLPAMRIWVVTIWKRTMRSRAKFLRWLRR